MEYRTLASLLSGKVFLPGSPQYINSTGSYFAAFENDLSPSCVVRPENTTEVSMVIQTISSDFPQTNIQLAIRGGGHTPWAGAANVDQGVTMDMRGLTGVQLNESTGIVSISAGESWKSVYEQLGRKGLAVAGGRVSKVGVAGLITGEYEVVLASGSVVIANARTNNDLFHALKGGSNNFGVVTRFDIPTFKQGQMWGGAIFYNSSVYHQLVQAFHDFASSTMPDEQAHVIMAMSWTAGRETGVSNVYHATPTAAPESLRPFTVIEPQRYKSLRQDSLLGFADEQSAFSTDGARQLYFTTTVRLDVDFMLHIRELWLKAIKPLEGLPGFTLSLVFQPLTKGVLTKSADRGVNSLGLSPDDGPLVIVLLNSVHNNPEDDDSVITAVLCLIQDIDADAALSGKSARYRFTNYGYADQKILEGYGQDSIAKLRAVSKKYDPTQFFQQAVPGGFKLSKVLEVRNSA
ncbi:MAG: hypothetical protein Q9222_003120 [Ikaeria aurantiellina]